MNNDLYQTVTNRIIASLEAGTPPWIRPWSDGCDDSDGQNRNLYTRKNYRGVNILLLNLEVMIRGYSSLSWLTYKQATDLGAHVRKGEHGTPIVFFQLKEIESETDEDGTHSKIVPLLRTYTVFNAEQVEGLPDRNEQVPVSNNWQAHESAEDVLLNSGAVIQHGGNRAYYAPDEDRIQLPPKTYFPKASDYYATALHELSHWTGHPIRCNRPLGRRHGIEAYAYEELVAEMGAAFLCAHCQLPARLEHASYLDSWLHALKQDKRLIFTAAGAAQKAADYLLATQMQSPVAKAA